MKVEDFDAECVVLNESDFFYLWCCDCQLRHLVLVDVVKAKDGTNVKIGMVRDQMATEHKRKEENIVLYKRKAKNKA